MARLIALIEDEDAIRENYSDALLKQGYQVAGYPDRHSAMAVFRKNLPDLVLLDIGLENEFEGGFDMCRELRQMSAALPIIFLTARDSDYDAISGLRLGADDYITKNITIPQLLARIAALFRRIEALSLPLVPDDTVRIDALLIDKNRLTVKWHEHKVDLTLTEFWIVHSLVKHPGHVKSREQLMSEARIFVDDTTVTSHIKRIRKKFMQVDANFDCIETMYGMGYRWKEN